MNSTVILNFQSHKFNYVLCTNGSFEFVSWVNKTQSFIALRGDFPLPALKLKKVSVFPRILHRNRLIRVQSSTGLAPEEEDGFVLEDVPHLTKFLPDLPQTFVTSEDVVAQNIVVQKGSKRGVYFRRAGPRERVYIIGDDGTQKNAEKIYQGYRKIKSLSDTDRVAGLKFLLSGLSSTEPV